MYNIDMYISINLVINQLSYRLALLAWVTRFLLAAAQAAAHSCTTCVPRLSPWGQPLRNARSARCKHLGEQTRLRVVGSGTSSLYPPIWGTLFGYDSDVLWVFLRGAVNGDKYEPARICIFVASLLGYIQLSPSYLRLAMYIDYIGDIDRPIIQEKHWW